FSLIDASVHTCQDLRYLFPVALALAVMAVWLLAEGLRLMGAALWQSLRDLPANPQRAVSLAAGGTPRKSTTLLICGLTLGTAPLVDLYIVSHYDKASSLKADPIMYDGAIDEINDETLRG